MKSPLYILRVSDGEIRLSKWQDGGQYSWTEGNAGCDCNRAIAFGNDHETDETPCGDTAYELVNKDGSPFTAFDAE